MLCKPSSFGLAEASEEYAYDIDGEPLIVREISRFLLISMA